MVRKLWACNTGLATYQVIDITEDLWGIAWHSNYGNISLSLSLFSQHILVSFSGVKGCTMPRSPRDPSGTGSCRGGLFTLQTPGEPYHESSETLHNLLSSFAWPRQTSTLTNSHQSTKGTIRNAKNEHSEKSEEGMGRNHFNRANAQTVVLDFLLT